MGDDWWVEQTRRQNRESFRHQPADTRREKIPDRFPDWMMRAAHRAAEKQTKEKS